MRQGYWLEFSVEEMKTVLKKSCNPVHYMCREIEKYAAIRREFLDHYLKDGYEENDFDILDADKLNDAWFPDIKCDVFISYSHLDVEESEELSKLLYRYFGLKAFVDSLFWNSCDELQKMIPESVKLIKTRSLSPDIILKEHPGKK